MSRSSILCLLVCLSAFIGSGLGITFNEIRNELKSAEVLRCGPGCNPFLIKVLFNSVLDKCNISVKCKKRFVLRLNRFGTTEHIQEYFVLFSKKINKKWGVRIQIDTLNTGARLVLVAVPKSSLTEPEVFSRPYVLGPLIPRSMYSAVGNFLNVYM